MTDPFLARFQAEADSPLYERGVGTHCCFCGLQCGLHLRVHHRMGNVVGVEPASGDLVACHKGLVAHEHVRHVERLQHPLVRSTDGQMVPISWDRAYTHIVQQINHIQGRYGHDAVAVYGGGALTNEAAYLLAKLARVALKTKFLDSSMRYGAQTAESVLRGVAGTPRRLPFPVRDIGATDCLVLVGSNLAETHPPLLRQIERIRQRGGRVYALDPRLTLTAEAASVHLRVPPGGDLAFLRAVARVIVDERLFDERFLSARTEGFGSFRAFAMLDPDPHELTLPRPLVEEVAFALARSHRGMILCGRGADQQPEGESVLGTAWNIMLALGKVGKFASGFGVLAGPGNGQGARDAGLGADILPGGRSLASDADRQAMKEVWPEAEFCPPEAHEDPDQGMNLWERILTGGIKGLIVVGSNPAVSSPSARQTLEALKKLRFLMVVDVVPTQTSAVAHAVLPACAWTEGEGTLTDLQGRIVYRARAQDPLGKARPDWMVIRDLGRRLGCAEEFAQSDAGAVFREFCAATAGAPRDYSGLDLEAVRLGEEYAGPQRLFEEGFRLPGGRASFFRATEGAIRGAAGEGRVSETLPGRGSSAESQDSMPARMITGKQSSHYLTGSLSRRTVGLQQRNDRLYVEVAPDLCLKHRLSEGELARIVTGAGELVLPVRRRADLPEGTIFIALHAERERNVNLLVPAAGPGNGSLWFKCVPARIHPV